MLSSRLIGQYFLYVYLRLINPTRAVLTSRNILLFLSNISFIPNVTINNNKLADEWCPRVKPHLLGPYSPRSGRSRWKLNRRFSSNQKLAVPPLVVYTDVLRLQPASNTSLCFPPTPSCRPIPIGWSTIWPAYPIRRGSSENADASNPPSISFVAVAYCQTNARRSR